MKRYALIVVSVALCCYAGRQAVAETIVYDFSRCTSGVMLNGQENWLFIGGGTNNKVSSGAAGWDGNYVIATGSDSTSYRINNAGWSFSITPNLDFDVSCLNLANSTNYYTQGGICHVTGAALTARIYMGVSYGNFYWYTSAWAGSLTVAHNLITDTVVRSGITFTAKGNNVYDAQPYYQIGAVRTNYGSPIQTTIDVSVFDSLLARAHLPSGQSSGILDNLTISQVPEPSTALLFIAGMGGLLAYAWRKRK